MKSRQKEQYRHRNVKHLVYSGNPVQFVGWELMIRATPYSCLGSVLHKDAKPKRPVG